MLNYYHICMELKIIKNLLSKTHILLIQEKVTHLSFCFFKLIFILTCSYKIIL